AVLPLLVTWLLLSWPGRWARGTALAILAGSVILVRNEMSVATVLLGLVCLALEWRLVRRSDRPFRWHLPRLLAAYGVPLSLTAALIVFAYFRSTVQFPDLRNTLRRKHTINMCQVYAVGYQQRHPEWNKNPWIENHELMRDTFGNDDPSLGQMLLGNPRATLEHFAWNWRLTPNGLQVLL